ncbi:hypothetical protein L596_022798 [Steinernema carpocapsae]|uniref:Uncharacterized protein n=1 Tax=Steinernema carpocapsae TaxID=34508 RepID=A0A4U5MMV6_STECR|nr:hypothetical protein L596_022798 [Steinernema carpocapsae]
MNFLSPFFIEGVIDLLSKPSESDCELLTRAWSVCVRPSSTQVNLTITATGHKLKKFYFHRGSAKNNPISPNDLLFQKRFLVSTINVQNGFWMRGALLDQSRLEIVKSVILRSQKAPSLVFASGVKGNPLLFRLLSGLPIAGVYGFLEKTADPLFLSYVVRQGALRSLIILKSHLSSFLLKTLMQIVEIPQFKHLTVEFYTSSEENFGVLVKETMRSLKVRSEKEKFVWNVQRESLGIIKEQLGEEASKVDVRQLKNGFGCSLMFCFHSGHMWNVMCDCNASNCLRKV